LKKPSNPKERNLLKGAIRRVFSRSELRRKIIDSSLQKEYSDPSRKRVTRWGKCASCKKLEPAYLMQVDHKEPIVPIGMTLEEMAWDKVIENVWCDESKLQALCKDCHKKKTKEEQKERRLLKKDKKNEKT
jgi:5-methylcytosine-specific restriction endonuclease McrA